MVDGKRHVATSPTAMAGGLIRGAIQILALTFFRVKHQEHPLADPVKQIFAFQFGILGESQNRTVKMPCCGEITAIDGRFEYRGQGVHEFRP